MKIAFIARNDGTDVRQTKICNTLNKLGHQVIYIGWDREPDTRKTTQMDPEIQGYIFRRKAGFGDLSPNGWPEFLTHVRRLLRQFKPDVIHVRDEPLAACLVPYRKILYKYLVLDIFDSLAARRFSNPVLKLFAYSARYLAYHGSDRIIETSEQLAALLGKSVTKKAVIIMNVPHDPGEKLSKDYPQELALQICTGGSLARERDGLEILLKAVDSLPPGSVQIQASGWFHDAYSRDIFVNHPAVTYQSLNSSYDFLKRAARCDALTYLRNDASETEYRSWVLPNRIFDAMSVGRPIIVSSTLKISSWVEKEKLGYVCDPKDYKALAKIFSHLYEHGNNCHNLQRGFGNSLPLNTHGK